MASRNTLHTLYGRADAGSAVGTSNRAAEIANRGGEQKAATSGIIPEISEARTRIIAKIKELYRPKPEVALAALTGISERTIEDQLADGRLSDAVLIAVIRDAGGGEILRTTMIGADPPWFSWFRRHAKMAFALKLQRMSRRLIREAIDADHTTSAAIAEAEEILSTEPNLRGDDGPALITSAGISRRALAPAR